MGSGSTLLEAARRGDPAALDALLQAHQGQIYRFGMSMCRDPQDAGDVLQETLLSLARGVGQIREDSIGSWLYTVARSHCAKRRRRRRGAPAPGDVVPMEDLEARLPSASPDPERALDAAELQRALSAAIQALEPMYREALILRDVEGLSAAEVATTLGIGEAAVKSRLHRARRQVREALAPTLTPSPLPAAAGPCPDVVRQLSRKLEGDVDARTCADLEAHVAACPRCRQLCDSLTATLALCRSAPSPEIPEELQRRVRGAVQEFLTRA